MQALFAPQADAGRPTHRPPRVPLFTKKPDAALQQNHPGVAAGLDGLFIPDTGLHLADVGLSPAGRGRAGTRQILSARGE